MLSVKEDALLKIDRFVLKTVMESNENISRNYLLIRLTEALAEALETLDYDVDRIEIKVSNRNKSTTVVLYTRRVS
ncbi:MAG: hypothetical protein QXT64_02715 [Desulfurococcaceae archaeon]